MNRAYTLLLALILLGFLASDGSTESYIGLYTDEAHTTISANNLEGTTLFDLWVWVLPGADGVMCAEYKLDLPTGLAVQTTEINPANCVVMGEAWGSPGISICFPECQTDWIWTAKLQLLLTDRIKRYLTVSEHEYAEAIHISNCLSGYPLEEATVFSILSINTALSPVLIGVEVTGPFSLIAIYDREVIEDDMYSIEVTPGDFLLFEKSNPSHTIDIASVYIIDGEEHKLNIVVDSVLDSEKVYSLISTDICAWGNYGYMCVHPVCGDCEIDFSGAIAAKAASWGAIKALVN